MIWKEDKSLIRTGNRPQVMSAIVNLVITLFRIRGVTGYAEETRRNAQDPRRGAPDARPPGPVTRLNTLRDFDESLAQPAQGPLNGRPPADGQQPWHRNHGQSTAHSMRLRCPHAKSLGHVRPGLRGSCP